MVQGFFLLSAWSQQLAKPPEAGSPPGPRVTITQPADASANQQTRPAAQFARLHRSTRF
jgi:hypothetical protein